MCPTARPSGRAPGKERKMEWLEWHVDRVYEAAERHPAIAGTAFLVMALVAFTIAGSIELGAMS